MPNMKTKATATDISMSISPGAIKTTVSVPYIKASISPIEINMFTQAVPVNNLVSDPVIMTDALLFNATVAMTEAVSFSETVAFSTTKPLTEAIPLAESLSISYVK